jgi:hypothetical protein
VSPPSITTVCPVTNAAAIVARRLQSMVVDPRGW